MLLSFLKKNGLTAVIFSFLLIVVFVPDAKALMMQGLLKIGLFSPNIEKTETNSTNLAGITFSNEKGQLVDLGDLKGKVILLNFWATWCPPCRAEMPGLSKLYKQFEKDKDVVFIFADADGNLAKSVKYMQKHNFFLPVYKVETNIPTKIFENTLPTTVIFDKQGRLSFRHEGLADYSDQKFVDFLNKLKGLN